MSVKDSEPLHYNPLLITVLPKERRSRHPYQLGAMGCLLTLGVWQLVIGTVPNAAVNVLDTPVAVFLNWVCIVAGAAGILAAVIPERIVRLRIRFWRWVFRTEFDATYFRLFEELGCHLLLASVWAAYGQTVWANFGLVKGYTLGLAAAVWFGGAAIARAMQILWTLRNAGFFSRSPSAIVGDATLPGIGEL
jgi:hypothetical protein